MDQHRHIIDSLGRANVCAALGIKTAAVSGALRAESFPSAWYLTLAEMCKDKGIDCPPCLFSFKVREGADDEKS